MLPSFKLNILSALMIVFNLWAIVITVASLNLLLTSVWIVLSVLESMLAVASSITTILLFLTTALQIQMSCFSPELKLEPLLSMCWSRPCSLRLIRLSREACSSNSMISSSDATPCGSILNLRVPSKSVGSWGIIVILSLNKFVLIREMLTPSINIAPESASMILHKASTIVDLPAPVLPTTPIFWVGWIVKLRFFNTRSVLFQYLALNCANWIHPLLGQSQGTNTSEVWFSWGMSVILRHLWYDTIDDSSFAITSDPSRISIPLSQKLISSTPNNTDEVLSLNSI